MSVIHDSLKFVGQVILRSVSQVDLRCINQVGVRCVRLVSLSQQGSERSVICLTIYLLLNSKIIT